MRHRKKGRIGCRPINWSHFIYSTLIRSVPVKWFFWNSRPSPFLETMQPCYTRHVKLPYFFVITDVCELNSSHDLFSKTRFVIYVLQPFVAFRISVQYTMRTTRHVRVLFWKELNFKNKTFYRFKSKLLGILYKNAGCGRKVDECKLCAEANAQ